MKILIIGAGAIGGSLATYLSQTDADVTILEKNDTVLNAIKRRGVTLRDGNKEYTGRVRAVKALEDTDKFDCCFSATRAYHLQSAVKSVLPYLAQDACVISMNNGVCIDALYEIVGDNSAWCSINFGAGIESEGSYYIKIHGGLTIGAKNGLTLSMVRVIEKLQEVIPVKVTGNIVGALYSKMLINSCITSTAVVSGLTLGEILSTKVGKKAFIGIIREGMKVAKVSGIKVPNYGKGLNYKLFASYGPIGAIYRGIVFPHLIKKYGGRTSATLEALKRGTKTEIDYFNGYVVRLAERYGISAPVNEKTVECVKLVEENLSNINSENIAKIAFATK